MAVVGTTGRVWSSGDDGVLRAWSIAHHECLQAVDTGAGRIASLVHMGNTIWACGMDKRIHVWDALTMDLVRRLEGHSSYVNGLLKVKRTETRVLWSYSMGDKKLVVWKYEKVGEDDSAEQLTQLQAPLPPAPPPNELAPLQAAYATMNTHITTLKSRLNLAEAAPRLTLNRTSQA